MKLLKEVLALQSETYQEWRVFAFVIRFLKNNNIDFFVDKTGSIYATKGESEIYPCVVSHMDTVAPIVEDKTIMELNGCLFAMNGVTMERIDIGGDDLVGVHNCLRTLLEFDDVKAVFFRGEEVGCNGSYEADVHFFDDCSFVLQFDRKGNEGFVINACGTELSSKEFQWSIEGILNNYGYSFVNGGMTDVMALKEIGVSCNVANIECGYYNPHSDESFVVIKEVEKALQMGFELISTFGYTEFTPHYNSEYIYKEKTQDPNWYVDELCKDCNAICSENNTGLCITCEQYYGIYETGYIN